MNIESIRKNYFISTDKNLLQVSKIHSYLSTQAYWCLGIPKETVKKAIEGSLCFGLYTNIQEGQIQIGFARVVTDKATFAWLCDLYLEKEHRGQGLSQWLMESIMNHPDLKNLRRFCLATKDAHGLYEKFGFQITKTPENWMEIKNNDLYQKLAAEQALESDAEKLLESAIESNLQMTYENRIEAHENARELLVDLRKAGEALHAKPQNPS